jgi:hypothetical protein
MKGFLVSVSVVAGLLGNLSAAEWVQAGLTTNQPMWGLKGRLQFAIHPGGFRGKDGGPRGLIRLGYPILTNGGYDLVNFIAVEPVVKGRRGFSELERSRLDGVAGKRFWATNSPGERPPGSGADAGRLANPAAGVEQLDLTLAIEPFDNGAHVRVVLSQRSDAPDELRLSVRAEPASAPLDYCILTATMGNLARARQLWLSNEVVSRRQLYPDYKGGGFAPHAMFPLERLQVTPAGDVLVAITTDEPNPAAVFPFPGTRHWYYGGAKVTQYWRKPKGAFRDDLHALVNARHTYWQSAQPIPGGVAFENFELRERFYDGQCSVFGITRRTPAELGFKQ